jgi:membrane-associated phospholipid phosphatase
MIRISRHEHRLAVRGWPDVAVLLAGAALFAAAAALIHRYHVAGAEQAIFRAINDHTVVPQFIVWPVMQLGNFLVIPAAVLVAAAFRRWRLAISLLTGGLAAYLLAAHLVRQSFVRGRPATLLSDVHLRGAPANGLGFVSGHVAVAAALAAIAWPYLGRRWRATVVTVPCLVAFARVYVGAHLPLDVVGGAGLGLAVAGAVRLVFGRTAPRPVEEQPPLPKQQRAASIEPPPWGARMVTHVIVIGVILLIGGGVVAIGEGALMAVFGSDSTLTSGTRRLSTPTIALVTAVDDIKGTNGFATTFDQPTLTVSATGSSRSQLLGIGPAAAVDRYLTGATFDKVTDLEVDPFRLNTVRQDGVAHPTPPTAQMFWPAQSSGTDALSWKVRDDRYLLVVMNNDDTQGVSVNGRGAPDVPHAFAIGVGLVIAGIVTVLISV